MAVPRGLNLGIVALTVAFGSVMPGDPVSAASGACDGVNTALTDAHKHEYAGLVAAAMDHKVKPSAVDISKFMESGAWSAVYASTPIADDGVLFFEAVSGQKRFKDVWGGVADPEDRPELIKWARALGAPENLAKCFAHVVID